MSDSAPHIYQLLLKHFGTQGWWPTSFSPQQISQYHSSPKINKFSNQEQFEICIGAILTQNTSWRNVFLALTSLVKKDCLNPKKISDLTLIQLGKMIRSAGFYNQKAKKLKIFSNYILRHHQGKMKLFFNQPFPILRKKLLAIYGIGPETADSILLYAGGFPIFVVDAYTKRIGKRLGLFLFDSYEDIQNYFHKHLPPDALLFNEYHALWVAHAKKFCKTKPFCSECPLKSICKFYLTEYSSHP